NPLVLVAEHQVIESRGIQDSIDFPQFQKDVTDWITDMNISQFQFKRLRKIFISLNRSVAPHIPTSVNTIRNWIMSAFEKKRDEVKSQLALSRSEIRFSFDLWTSPNHLSIVGIIAHYFSSSGKAKDCLLGLKRVCGTHSGENMAQCIVPVLEHYERKNRIKYFVLDNISSNDLCVRAILQRLRPDLDPKTHVANLAGKAFLFGNSKEIPRTQIRALLMHSDFWIRLTPDNCSRQAFSWCPVSVA